MAPRPKPWFRFYVETVHDRKIRRLKPEHRWLWVVVLACARSSSTPGELLVGDDPMELDDIADAAAMPTSTVKAGLGILERAGMIDRTDAGAWRAVKFLERQFENDFHDRRAELSRDKELRASIRERDGDNCRYCGRVVDWKDRRGAAGGTYDHVDPKGPNELENVVVSCRACNTGKGSRTPEAANKPLLPPRSSSRPKSDLDPRPSSLCTESESETEENSSTNGLTTRPPGPVDDEVSAKVDTIIELIARNRARKRNPDNPGRYTAAITANLRKELDLTRLRRLIVDHPGAPVEMLAGAAIGEPTPYLAHYRREAIA